MTAEQPDATLYDYLIQSCEAGSSDTALVYFGRKVTFGDFIAEIDASAKALWAQGVRRGDVVTIVSLATPETYALVYAASRIGAMVNMEYATVAPAVLAESLRKTGSKMLLVLDLFTEEFKKELATDGVVSVILPIGRSMGPLMRVGALLRRKPRGNLCALSYQDFLRAGRATSIIEAHEGGLALALLSTSGTTGEPKKVVLSSNAVNSIAWQYRYCGMDFKSGDTYLSTTPPFLSFGMVLSMHVPLCLGVVNYLAPDPSVDAVARLYLKVKPQHCVKAPAYLEAIVDAFSRNRMDLSFIKTLAVGGESLQPGRREEIDDFLFRRGARVGVVHGYGMTEVSSSAVTEVPGRQRRGSVGIPLCGVNVKVVDGEKGCELGYGRVGELWINSPGAMMGYFENETATRDALHTDEDGAVWVRTGDLASIDEDGFVFLCGRIKRIAMVIDPVTKQVEKVFPEQIENELSKLPGITACAVVVPMGNNRLGMPYAFVVPAKTSHFDKDAVGEALRRVLPVHSCPVDYFLVEEIPLLSSGKVDYRALEERIRGSVTS
ncbi:acyl--CoA ligase [Adlercreutzia muris]|uniref:class I adenylate-forming enzyme family protein n=1 Tax=Adlercreutzia muris TaxID=1796610 RepID=UPI0021D5D3F2|nr:class I adenylate-forming enzyme family protein [Adlercreutzia muris]MCU7585296.1 acyl--CoA ligase [Adlercreutzia muris]